MLDEFKTLNDREIDALVAEKVFGWKWASFLGTAYLLHPDDFEYTLWPGSSWREGKHGDWKQEPMWRQDTFGSRPAFRAVPKYTADLNEVHRAEAEVIDRLGLQAWMNGFSHAVPEETRFRASAKERCIACLLAMEKTNAVGD